MYRRITLSLVILFIAGCARLPRVQRYTPVYPERLPSAQEEIAPEVKITKLVLDPGHGGDDPGAIDRTGIKEKEINLDIALRIKRQIEAEGRLAVILTRADDRYLSLYKRVHSVRLNRADLFVSIHANSAYKRTARGFEIFYLSYAVDDLYRASRLANLDIGIEGIYKRNPRINTILWDMRLTDNRRQAIRLCQLISRQLKERLGIKNRGIKPSQFYVLRYALVPAVLIEVGFISNSSEGAKLKSISYRSNIANAIAQGIIRYIAEFEA